MPITHRDIETIIGIIYPVIGKKTWGASLVDNGNRISIEFGEPMPSEWELEKVRGMWHLFTDMCEWRLEKNGDVLSGSQDHSSKIELALLQVNGSFLKSFDLKLPALNATFIFDNQVVLQIFPASFIDAEALHWTLSLPQNWQVLEIGPGVTWSIQKYTDSRKKVTKDAP